MKTYNVAFSDYLAGRGITVVQKANNQRAAIQRARKVANKMHAKWKVEGVGFCFDAIWTKGWSSND